MDQGIPGLVASSGQTLNIANAYDNPHFNQIIDKKTGYNTRSILCMPIKAENKTIGVLQFVNKLTGSGVFTTEDEEILQIFLSIAGPIILESVIYEELQGKSKGRNVDGSNNLHHDTKETVSPGSSMVSSKSINKKMLAGFKEEQDGDDDDDE